MLLSTPILEDIKIEYDVNGNQYSFGTTVKASIGKLNGIEEITTVRLGVKSIDFVTTLKTTFSGNVKSSQLRFLHDGYISNFKTSIEAKYDDQTIKADASYKRYPSNEGSLTLKTPFEKLRVVNIKIEQTGSVKSFTTTGSLQYAPDRKLEGYERTQIKASVSSKPYHAALNIQTSYLPEIDYSVNADIKMKDDTYYLSGNAAIGEKKITIAMEKTPSSININLDTPIKGYERTQIKASASRKPYHAALNIQASYISEIDFDARLTNQRFDELDGSLTLKTGLYNLQNIRVSMKMKNLGELKSHIEAFLTKRNGITIDASLTETDSSLSVSTPWEALRTAYGYLKYDWRSKTNNLVVATNMKINKETLYDVDFEMDAEKRKEITLIINVNEPKQMRFELNKLLSSETYMLVNWNKQDKDSSCRMDVKFNSDWSDKKQIASYRGVCGSKSYSIGASYHRPDESSTMVLFIEKDDIKTHGIETIFEKNGQAKYTLQLPSRTVVLSTVSSGYGLSSQVFDFSWDAERDQNKRVVIKTKSDGDELTLGLEMPSLGKDLQLDYKMLIGSGNVIYDGRTAFRYSKDSRKTFTLSSKLEDVSGQNPDKTLHLNAKFSDEKGIYAELFRDVNQKKTVDSLLNLRLKSSKILHTRVHWRPSIISDLKAEITKRIEEYGIRSAMAVEESSGEINKEISNKRRLFQAAYTEEIKSYADAINDKLSELRTLKAKMPFTFKTFRLDAYSKDTYISMGGQLNSISTNSYQRLLGSSAYKYWEFEENVNALVDKIFDELKKRCYKGGVCFKRDFRKCTQIQSY
ncbi:unnamed protein product [Mytilus edulis]|uniref:Uncharacterized protein n=1 Tax=Mytilus edulis TaxID=6550 RepID=A0A8S3RST5_MYTED|nr:unnamed protein product [Mytilus edulis]